MTRSVEQWKEILAGMFPQSAAVRILGDITHYQSGRAYEQKDREQLANALMAFASLQRNDDTDEAA